jgi:hypothetical protein
VGTNGGGETRFAFTFETSVDRCFFDSGWVNGADGMTNFSPQPEHFPVRPANSAFTRIFLPHFSQSNSIIVRCFLVLGA